MLDCGLQARTLLSCVLGREQPPSAHAQPLDEAAYEHVRCKRVKLGCRAAVKLDEALDAFPRLRRHLRRLGGRSESQDEVELAPAGNLDHARELDLAQLDRRPCKRPDDGCRVLRVHEQSQPGEDVAHLGPLEEASLLVCDRQALRRRRRDSRAGHIPRIRAEGPRLATLFEWT
jgi:hypothetical protein